jgi:hypothetical protein
MPKDERVRELAFEGLTSDSWRVRHSAVRVLEDWLHESAIRDALLGILDDDDYRVRRAAAKALSSLLDEDVSVRETLVQILENKSDSLYGWPFGRRKILADYSSEYIRAEIESLDRPDGYSPSGAEPEEVERSRSDPVFRSGLLDLLNSATKGVSRQAVARILVHCLDMGAEVEVALSKILSGGNFTVRLAIIDELAGLESVGFGSWAWSILPEWLSVEAVPDFIEFIDVQEEWLEEIRLKIARIIGSRLQDDDSLKSLVLELLKSARSSARLGGILAVLLWQGGPPEYFLAQALEAIDDPRDRASYRSRLSAASFFITRREHSEEAIALCLEVLDYGIHPWEHLQSSKYDRKQAALILGKLESLEFNQNVYDRLLRTMKEDEDFEVREAAYDSLVRLAAVRDRQAAGA